MTPKKSGPIQPTNSIAETLSQCHLHQVSGSRLSESSAVSRGKGNEHLEKNRRAHRSGPIFPESPTYDLKKWAKKEPFDPHVAKQCLEDLSEIVVEFSKKYPLHTHRIPDMQNGEDSLVAFVGAMVRSMARTEEKLIALNQQALAASRAKEQFLANLSHEVRTPMNGIFGMVNHLLETDLTPLQRDYLETVHSSSELLLNLLNDVLDVSKLNSSELKLHLRNFNFRKLIRELNHLYEPLAAESGNSYNTFIDDKIPEYLIGDDLRLKQILSNLISNAVKFTSEGDIELHVCLGATTEEYLELHFSVIDTGVGIPSSAIPTLFDPFTRVENSTTRPTEGTGLGLAICRNLIYLMKGEISVDTEPGVGSDFRFDCRLNKGTSPTTRGSSLNQSNVILPGPPEALKRKLKVLVVDDKKVNQKVAGISLQKLGCQVLTANDGVEAIAAASGDEIFDLICMDVCMPNMDGMEATRRIRELDSPNAKTRILGLTGLASSEDHDRCREAGMNNVITKPIDFELLREFIDTPISDDSIALRS